jgi:hypothetical protein
MASQQDNRLEHIQLGKKQGLINDRKANRLSLGYSFFSVLPMGNGVGAPTGYIINGPPTTNMTSATAQMG